MSDAAQIRNLMNSLQIINENINNEDILEEGFFSELLDTVLAKFSDKAKGRVLITKEAKTIKTAWINYIGQLQTTGKNIENEDDYISTLTQWAIHKLKCDKAVVAKALQSIGKQAKSAYRSNEKTDTSNAKAALEKQKQIEKSKDSQENNTPKEDLFASYNNLQKYLGESKEFLIEGFNLKDKELMKFCCSLVLYGEEMKKQSPFIDQLQSKIVTQMKNGSASDSDDDDDEDTEQENHGKTQNRSSGNQHKLDKQHLRQNLKSIGITAKIDDLADEFKDISYKDAKNNNKLPKVGFAFLKTLAGKDVE